jgi:hypothetical protein
MLLVPHLIPVQQSERRQWASRVHFLRVSPPGIAHRFHSGRPDAAACQLIDSKDQMGSVDQIRKRPPPMHKNGTRTHNPPIPDAPAANATNVTRCNTKMDKPRSVIRTAPPPATHATPACPPEIGLEYQKDLLAIMVTGDGK